MLDGRAQPPTFSYSLTTALDTVAPGQTVPFTLQVTNLTNTSQTATLTCSVPDFTTYGAFGAGAVRSVTFSGVAAGAAMETSINLIVTSGAQAPPSGTLIDLTTTDGVRGASVARTVVVN